MDSGHNNPPIDADPIRDRLAETAKALIARRDDLVARYDDLPILIDGEDDAATMAEYIKDVQACDKALEAARVAEKEPFLAAGRTVDGFFKKAMEPLVKTKRAAESALTEYQRKKAEAERRARQEAERKAREEAERARREAEELAAKMREDTDLVAAVAAEQAALQASADARRAEREASAPAAEISRTRSERGAVASLRTYWDFRNLDRSAIDLDALRPHLPQAAIETAIRSFIKAGGRSLAGCEIFENTASVVR